MYISYIIHFSTSSLNLPCEDLNRSSPEGQKIVFKLTSEATRSRVAQRRNLLFFFFL